MENMPVRSPIMDNNARASRNHASKCAQAWIAVSGRRINRSVCFITLVKFIRFPQLQTWRAHKNWFLRDSEFVPQYRLYTVLYIHAVFEPSVGLKITEDCTERKKAGENQEILFLLANIYITPTERGGMVIVTRPKDICHRGILDYPYEL